MIFERKDSASITCIPLMCHAQRIPRCSMNDNHLTQKGRGKRLLPLQGNLAFLCQLKQTIPCEDSYGQEGERQQDAPSAMISAVMNGVWRGCGLIGVGAHDTANTTPPRGEHYGCTLGYVAAGAGDPQRLYRRPDWTARASVTSGRQVHGRVPGGGG